MSHAEDEGMQGHDRWLQPLREGEGPACEYVAHCSRPAPHTGMHYHDGLWLVEARATAGAVEPPLDRDQLFTSLDRRFGLNVARFADALVYGDGSAKFVHESGAPHRDQNGHPIPDYHSCGCQPTRHHPQCSVSFASDATTGQGICDCGLAGGAAGAVEGADPPPESPERRFLLALVDTLYGGAEKSDDLADRLDAIAGVLDKVDAATDSYIEEKGADHRIDRGFQADLREAASRLRATTPEAPAR